MDMVWVSIGLRVVATLVTFIAFLTLPIVLVSVLSAGYLITLGQGILVFAASISAALVLTGVIWAFGW